MTRDEAIQIILGRCGNRINDAFLKQQCILELAMKQETVLEQADFKPWFLLSEFMHATCGANDARMPLPLRFLQEHEEGLLWIRVPGQAKYTPLIHDDVDTLEARYLDAANTLPVAYGVARQYAMLFPTPNLAYPMKMRCYQREEKLVYPYGEPGTNPTTNLWLTYAADWLIGEAGAVIAGSYLKDAATAQEFKEEARAARARLYVDHVAREEMNRTRSAGDD